MLNPDKIPETVRTGGGSSTVCPDSEKETAEKSAHTGAGTFSDSFHPIDVKTINQTFDRVFRENQAKLKLKAAQIVGSKEAADDVVNDVFLKTYRLVSDGKKINVETIDGWLFKCVQNASFNEIRKRKRAHNVPIADDDPDLAGLHDAGDLAYSEDRSMQVLDTVSGLPSKQRKAFLLYDVHGLSYKEAATEMHVSSSSIRQLLFRARNNIRKNLGPETAGLAAPILRSDVFSIDRKTNFVDRLIHLISDTTTRYFGHFNNFAERIVGVSTPIIAVIVLGAAVVITQTRSQEPAKGAVVDPSMLIVSIHSNPVGDLDLIQGQVSPVTGSSRNGSGGSNSKTLPGNASTYPAISLPRGRSAAVRNRLANLLENCKTCNGSVLAAIRSFMKEHGIEPGQVLQQGQDRRQPRRQERRHQRRQERRQERRADRRETLSSEQTGAGTKNSSGSGTKKKPSTKGKSGTGKSSDSSGSKGSDSGGNSNSTSPSNGSGSDSTAPTKPSIPKPEPDRSWTPPSGSGSGSGSGSEPPSLPDGPFGGH